MYSSTRATLEGKDDKKGIVTMCQPKPGIRCAYHATQKINRIKSQIDAKQEALQDKNLTEVQRGRLHRSLQNFSVKLENAKFEYLLTDRGIEEARREARGVTDSALYAQMRADIRNAQTIRSRRNFARSQIQDAERGYGSTLSRQARGQGFSTFEYPVILPEFTKSVEAQQYVNERKRNDKHLREHLQNYMDTSGSQARIREMADKIGRETALASYAATVATRLAQQESDQVDPIDTNLRWSSWSITGVDYDYNTEYDHDSYGCDDEGICRCGRIYDARVTEVDTSSLLASLTNRNSVPDEIVEYANQVGIQDPDNWDVEVTGGYYGDEIEGASMTNPGVAEKISEFIATWNAHHRA